MRYGEFLRLNDEEKQSAYDKLDKKGKDELFDSWKKTAIAVSHDYSAFFQKEYQVEFDTVNTK